MNGDISYIFTGDMGDTTYKQTNNVTYDIIVTPLPLDFSITYSLSIGGTDFDW